jgi:hypothetical protein
MRTIYISIIGILLFVGCNFNKSIEKDFTTGLYTKGDGLSSDNVFLSVNNEKTKETTFIYGQKFKMVFDDIRGFKKENGNVFPGMVISIIDDQGDTIMQSGDLYGDYSDGIALSPLTLSAAVTAASPIISGNKYTMYVKIRDKKERGTLTGEVNFNVVSNDQIIIDTEGVAFNEIYLFSRERNIVIPDNKIKYNENIYLIFEGLDGFKEVNGMVFPGLSLKARDDNDNIILDYDDLFKGLDESGVEISNFNTRISSHFILDPGEIKNPLNLDVTVWDKKSNARISAKTELIIE